MEKKSNDKDGNYLQKLYYAKVSMVESQDLISKMSRRAYSKCSILIYAILIAIFPGIPLAFKSFYMANFGVLSYYGIKALICNLPIAAIVAIFVNNAIITNGSGLFYEHRVIKHLKESIARIEKFFPMINDVSLKKARNDFEEVKRRSSLLNSNNNTSVKLKASSKPVLSLRKHRRRVRKSLKREYDI